MNHLVSVFHERRCSHHQNAPHFVLQSSLLPWTVVRTLTLMDLPYQPGSSLSDPAHFLFLMLMYVQASMFFLKYKPLSIVGIQISGPQALSCSPPTYSDVGRGGSKLCVLVPMHRCKPTSYII